MKHTKICSIFLILMLLTTGCSLRTETPADTTQTKEDAAHKFAERLISTYNDDFSVRGYTKRISSSELKWEHHYHRMNSEYTLEQTDDNHYTLYTTYTDYVSIDTAPSPNDAYDLIKHRTNGTYSVRTFLKYENDKWNFDEDGISDVLKPDSDHWVREAVFTALIIVN